MVVIQKDGVTAIADHITSDHITSTGHNIKWDHFEILATAGVLIFTVKSKSLC